VGGVRRRELPFLTPTVSFVGEPLYQDFLEREDFKKQFRMSDLRFFFENLATNFLLSTTPPSPHMLSSNCRSFLSRRGFVIIVRILCSLTSVPPKSSPLVLRAAGFTLSSFLRFIFFAALSALRAAVDVIFPNVRYTAVFFWVGGAGDFLFWAADRSQRHFSTSLSLLRSLDHRGAKTQGIIPFVIRFFEFFFFLLFSPPMLHGVQRFPFLPPFSCRSIRKENIFAQESSHPPWRWSLRFLCGPGKRWLFPFDCISVNSRASICP